MNIRIYNTSGTLVYTIPVASGSTYTWKLQDSEYITIKFATRKRIGLTKGMYCDIDKLGRFEIVEKPQPKRSSSVNGYEWELRMDRPWARFANFIHFFSRTSTGREASWTITDNILVHASALLDGINAAGLTYDGTTAYSVAVDDSVVNVSESKVITYDAISLWDAAIAIAEAFDCEVWMSQNEIHFGRCEQGDIIYELEENKQIQPISRTEDSDEHGTRLYAFGSTRNLPSDYRSTGSSTFVSGISEKRLQLPSGTPYVEQSVDSAEIVEVVKTYDDIYPRALLRITEVTSKSYTDTDEDTNETTTWTAYRFRAVIDSSDDKFIFKEEYKSKTTEDALSIHFESGKLAGMDFEVHWNPDDTTGGSDDDVFEITRNETYTIELPDTTFYPAVGDTMYMYNMDVQAVDEQLLTAAEKELQAAAEEDLENLTRDSGTYTAPTNPVIFARREWRFSYGQRVKLISPTYLPTEVENARESRVIGWSLQLDNLYKGDYTIGESAAYSRSAALRSEMETLVVQSGKTLANTGSGSSVTILRNGQTSVTPSDTNVNSALRADNRYLGKYQADSTNYIVSFLKGLIAKATSTFEGIVANSVSVVNNYINLATGEIKELFSTSDFEQGYVGGRGFAVYRDANQNICIEADNAVIRKKMTLAEVEVKSLSYVGGDLVMSHAGNTIVRVEPYNADGYECGSGDIPAYYRCYFLSDNGEERVVNQWRVGDQGRSQTANLSSGNSHDVSNRGYWRLVINADYQSMIDGTEYAYVDLSNRLKEDIAVDDITYSCDGYDTSMTDAPQAGDRLVQMGNQIDATRQYLRIEYITEARSVAYINVDKFELSGHESMIISPMATGFATNNFFLFDPNDIKKTSRLLVYRGVYSSSDTYSLNDYVTYGSDLYAYIGSSSSINVAPDSDSSVWRQMTVAGDAVSISSVVTKYIVSDSGDAHPATTAAWLDEYPSDVANGKWVWTWRRITLTNGDKTDEFSANYVAKDGDPLTFDQLTKEQKDELKGDSVTIVSTAVAYAVTDDNTQPSSFPESTIPEDIAQGQYLWSKTTITFSDGEPIVTYAVTRYAKDGDKLTIASKSVTYAVTTTSTQPSDSSFKYSAIPAVDEGSYVWTRTYIKYSDSVEVISYSVTYVAKDGTNGNSFGGVTEYYALSDSATTEPTDWKTSPETPTKAQPYLWNYERVWTIDANNTRTYTATPAAVISVYVEGEDGWSIDHVDEYYLATSQSTGITTSTSGWGAANEIQTITKDKPYLWNYEEITYTKDGYADKTTKTAPVIIGHFGQDGDPLTITSIAYDVTEQMTDSPTYRFDDINDALANAEKGWYLWTMTTYSDGKSEESVSQIGVVLTDEEKAELQGAAGADAWDWAVTPQVLTYDTNEQGLVDDYSQVVAISVKRGGVDATLTYDNVGKSNVESNGVSITGSNTTALSVQITAISPTTVGTHTISAAKGYIQLDVTATIDTAHDTRTINVPFSVNTNAHFMTSINSLESWKQGREAIYNDAGTGTLNQKIAELEITADGITSVVKKVEGLTDGGGNILDNAALLEPMAMNGSAKAGSYGTAFFRPTGETYKAADVYRGTCASRSSIYAVGSIGYAFIASLVDGNSYTITIYAKRGTSATFNSNFVLYVRHTNRSGSSYDSTEIAKNIVGSTSMNALSTSEWTAYTFAFTYSQNSSYPYVGIYIGCARNGDVFFAEPLINSSVPTWTNIYFQSMSNVAQIYIAFDQNPLIAHNGQRYLHIKGLNNSSSAWAGVVWGKSVNGADNFTASVWARTPSVSGLDSGAQLELNTARGYLNSTTPDGYTNNTWTRLSCTLASNTAGSTATLEFGIYLVMNGEVYFSEPQLEEGDVATAWSPKASDSSTKSVQSSITQLADSITSVVETSEGLSSRIEQLVNSIMLMVTNKLSQSGLIINEDGVKLVGGKVTYVGSDGSTKLVEATEGGHFVFYYGDGTAAYDIGPGGADGALDYESGFATVRYASTSNVMSASNMIANVGNLDVTIYRYYAGCTGGKINTEQVGRDGRYYTSTSLDSESGLPTGTAVDGEWYLLNTLASAAEDSLEGTYTWDVYYFNNGTAKVIGSIQIDRTESGSLTVYYTRDGVGFNPTTGDDIPFGENFY